VLYYATQVEKLIDLSSEEIVIVHRTFYVYYSALSSYIVRKSFQVQDLLVFPGKSCKRNSINYSSMESLLTRGG
jgi:hypothetical protein